MITTLKLLNQEETQKKNVSEHAVFDYCFVQHKNVPIQQKTKHTHKQMCKRKQN